MLPQPEPIAPDQFGPYEVYERLGLGGMATVHRAKKRGPDGYERSVALKRMLSHLAEDATFVASFIREAKVASILVHPNIAQVYDFGRINGIYYIAMELVPGFDLRKLLRFSNRANESIPLAIVLSILGEMCDALEYAHTYVDEHRQALRIIHRDISPSNMIVAHTGHLKIIDFGIAKAASRQLHTESGQVKGKLGYMSPEAALGMQLTPVADVFSMGVVAWELVTSSPLFSSRTDFETMRRIREGEIVPPSTKNPICPPDLDRIILQALERDPERRLASAGSFRRALDAIGAKAGLQLGPRAVSEWIRQFIQPEDFMRYSGGGQLAQDAPTSVLRPSAKARLQRTQDEIALATEIWGEDQAMTSAEAGPDFSVANPNALPLPAPITMNLPPVYGNARVFPNTSPVAPLPSMSSPHMATHASGPQMAPSARSGPQMAPSGPYTAPPGLHFGTDPSLSISALPMPGTTTIRPSRGGLVLVGILTVVAAALAAVFIFKQTGGGGDAPVTPTAPSAQLTVNLEPADAVVELEGKILGHASPVVTKLAPGNYELTIKHAEYKTATKLVTLADRDALAVDIELQRAQTRLSVDSDPRGLPVTVDSKPAGNTPLDFDTTTGPHKLVVGSGTDFWSQDIVASLAQDNKYMAKLAGAPPQTPSPGQHHPTHVASNTHHGTAHVEHVDKDPPIETKDAAKDPPAKDPTPPVKDPPVKDPTPPVKDPTPPIKDPTPPTPARTPVVAATAVTKLSGDVPTIRGDKDGDVLVKMCIDEGGKVSSVKVVKATTDMPPDLVTALQGWRYKPYVNKDNKATAACFALSLRVVVKRAD